MAQGSGSLGNRKIKLIFLMVKIYKEEPFGQNLFGLFFFFLYK